jgi:membrane protease YdiL (CAAX protease family)
VAFGLASLHPLPSRIIGVSVPASVAPVALLLTYLHAAVEIPLEGLAMYFGEEYGWRRYLQQQLECLGRLPAAALIGFVWGVWHVPILATGVHTYPLTAVGIGLALSFFTLWGIVQSFAAWRSNSIWLPAFLHGLVNSTHMFLVSNIARPEQPLRSFGLGACGVVSLAVVVTLLARHPVWRESS